MTIAVTGASGQLGRLVVASLKQTVPASTIVALVRSPASHGALFDDTRQLSALIGRPTTPISASVAQAIA